MWKASAGGTQTVARDLVWIVCSSVGPQATGQVGLPRAGGNFENEENWNIIKWAILYLICFLLGNSPASEF